MGMQSHCKVSKKYNNRVILSAQIAFLVTYRAKSGYYLVFSELFRNFAVANINQNKPLIITYEQSYH